MMKLVKVMRATERTVVGGHSLSPTPTARRDSKKAISWLFLGCSKSDADRVII